MLHLSFRAKLLLAMMLIVAGVTVTTLLIMQERVRLSYERLFKELFRAQISSFLREREFRLNPVRERVMAAAASPRLVAAMENAGQPGTTTQDVDDLYQNALDQLLETLNASKNADAADTTKPDESAYFFFMNVKGEVLRPSEKIKLPFALPTLGRTAPQMTQIGKQMLTDRKTKVGYLAPEVTPGKTALREMVFTPITDQVSHQFLGILAIGFPLPTAANQDTRLTPGLNEGGLPATADAVHGGIWLDDRLIAPYFSSANLDALQQEIKTGLESGQGEQRSFETRIDGVEHRVYCLELNPGSEFPEAWQVYLYSLAGAEEEKRDLRWKLSVAGLAALLGALAFSLVISHSLSIPIREVVKGTRDIERGIYDVKVPVRSRDEIGILAGAFNQMAEGLALKEKYRSVLNMVTDKGVAEELISGKIALGGELREISVLFCDIRGFTALTQGMPPQEVIQMLNEHMTGLTRVVYECDGVVDKFVGDLIMAVFGAPKNTGRDVLNAALCARRMIAERTRLNQTGGHKIEMGIGIATGQAVAGCMGSQDRLNYTVLGERVNLAARLCSTAGRMEVVIDEATREQLGTRVEVTPLHDLKLKGFSSTITAYKLINVYLEPALT